MIFLANPKVQTPSPNSLCGGPYAGRTLLAYLMPTSLQFRTVLPAFCNCFLKKTPLNFLPRLGLEEFPGTQHRKAEKKYAQAFRPWVNLSFS